jgi:hypothetical protein
MDRQASKSEIVESRIIRKRKEQKIIHLTSKEA